MLSRQEVAFILGQSIPEELRPGVCITSYSRGDIIFKAGTAHTKFFLVATGAVFVSNPSALEHGGVGYFRAPSLLSERITQAPSLEQHPFTARVVEDATVLKVKKDRVESLINRSRELEKELQRAQERDSDYILRRLLVLSSGDSSQRIAATLLDVTDPESVEVLLTQGELAALANLSRESVNKFIAEWAKKGILLTPRGNSQHAMILIRPGILRQIAAGAKDVDTTSGRPSSRKSAN